MLYFIYFLTSVYCIIKYKISIPILYIYSGLILLVSIFLYDDIVMIDYLRLSLLANLFILIGYIVGNKLKPTKKNNTNLIIINSKSLFFFLKFSILIILFHYVLIGIPLLSDQINILRFSQSSSGYAGIPSRFASYMPHLFFIILSLASGSDIFTNKQKIFFFSTVILLLMAQGNKSSLLQLVFLGIIVYPQSLYKKNYLKYSFVLIFFSLFFAFFTWNKLNVLEFWSFKEYLTARYTSIMHETGYILTGFSYSNFFFLFQNPLLNDLFYPLTKVFTNELSTLNSQLSRYYYGVLYAEDFSVPVTPGWFSYHLFLFKNSITITYIFCFLFGLINAYIYSWGFIENNFLKKISSLYILYWFYVGYGTGNIYYLVFNVAFCLFLFIFIYKIRKF